MHLPAVVLSLGIVGAVLAYIASFWFAISFTRDTPHRSYSILAGKGQVFIVECDLNVNVQPHGVEVSRLAMRDFDDWVADRENESDARPFLGFEWIDQRMADSPDRWRMARIPGWPLLAIVIAPAAFLLPRWRKQLRNMKWLCAGCGYDLRATPARCPECGLLVQNSTGIMIRE